MTQPNTAQVKSPYYPLTNEEWLKVTQELKPAEIVILYHLRTLTPFGERPTPVGVRDLAKTLSLNPGTVSRALKRLDQLKYIELELVQVNVKVLSKGLLFDRKHAPAETPENPGISPELPPSTGNSPLTEVLSADLERCLQTTPVVSTQQLLSTDNTCTPEPAPGKGFGGSKTLNKTSKEFKKERDARARKKSEVGMSTGKSQPQISDLATNKEKISEQVAVSFGWDRYSAPGGDPEFFEFVVRRAAKLPDSPVDVRCVAEGWIRKQGHLLYPQYLAWKESERQIEAAKAAAELPPPPPPALFPPQVPDLTLEDRLERYTILWKTPVCRKGIRDSITRHPHWGLRIGKFGPELVEGVTLNQEKNSASSPEVG